MACLGKKGRESLISLARRAKKIDLCFAEMYSLIRLVEDGTESLAGGKEGERREQEEERRVNVTSISIFAYLFQRLNKPFS